MSNITHFSKGKQVQISEHQLLRLLESIRTAKFRLASGIANDSQDECLEEFEFFKEFSPQLASLFAEELAA